jgi:beta-mannosidase
MVARNRYDESLLPEQHLWGPRDYYKSRFYNESTAHFASEIGYHGCPNVSSIKKFISPDCWWPYQGNVQWRIHATDCSINPGAAAYRVKLMADQVKELFGFEPATLETFALASQISQAEAKKYFIELFRLAKWRRTGIIWWNLLDGWPQFSDAVVDYYFTKKLAYHYIKRVQQPLCIMVDEPENWHCRVVAGNDTLTEKRGTYRVWDSDSGETLLGGGFTAIANQNTHLGNIPVSHGEHRLFLIEWEIGTAKYGNHYLFGKLPFSYEQYAAWLNKIACLPEPFDTNIVAR